MTAGQVPLNVKATAIVTTLVHWLVLWGPVTGALFFWGGASYGAPMTPLPPQVKVREPRSI